MCKSQGSNDSEIESDSEDFNFECKEVVERTNLVCLYFLFQVCTKVIDLKIYI